MEPKPGIKSSEFILTIIQAAAGLLLSFAASNGWIVPEDIDTAEVQSEIAEVYNEATDGDDDVRALVNGGLGLAGLIVSGLAVGGYTKSRKEVKVATASAATDPEADPDPIED